MRKQVLACLLLGALGAQAQEKFVVEGQLKHIFRRNRVQFDEARGECREYGGYRHVAERHIPF